MKKKISLISFLIFLFLLLPNIVNAQTKVLRCEYNMIYTPQDDSGKLKQKEVGFPVAIDVYDDKSTVWTDLNGKETIDISKRNPYINLYQDGKKINSINSIYFPTSESYYNNAKVSGGYKCPGLYLKNLEPGHEVMIGTYGNRDGMIQAKITKEEVTKQSDKITIISECNREYNRSIKNVAALLNFNFRIYSNGKKEFCFKDKKTNSDAACSPVSDEKGTYALNNAISDSDGKSAISMTINIDAKQSKKIYEYLSKNKNKCPDSLYLYEKNFTEGVYNLTTDKSETEGYNSTDINEDSESSLNLKYDPGTVVTGCEVIPKDIRDWIIRALKLVRYIALALVIILGALDFIKAAASGEPDSIKKAGQSFLKRLIAVIILFLLPYIVEFILNMIDIVGVDKNNINCT